MKMMILTQQRLQCQSFPFDSKGYCVINPTFYVLDLVNDQ